MKGNEIIKLFCDTHLKEKGFKFSPSVADIGQVKSLSKEEDIVELIGGFFKLNDPFLNEKGYFLRFLPSKINDIRLNISKSKPKDSWGGML